MGGKTCPVEVVHRFHQTLDHSATHVLHIGSTSLVLRRNSGNGPQLRFRTPPNPPRDSNVAASPLSPLDATTKHLFALQGSLFLVLLKLKTWID